MSQQSQEDDNGKAALKAGLPIDGKGAVDGESAVDPSASASAGRPPVTKKLRQQSDSRATSSLMGMEPPLLLRREQLTAEFREAAGDEHEEGDEGDEGADDDQTKPGKNGNSKGSAKAKAKAKAKARAKGKAKARAKAKAKATAKARPKASAKGKAKAKAKGKAKSVGASQNELKEPDNQADEEMLPEAAAEAAPSAPKRKAKDPKEKKTGKTKGDEPCEEVGAEPKKTTWARRYVPASGTPLLRFKAIMETFEAEIAPKIQRQSSYQDSAVRAGVSI